MKLKLKIDINIVESLKDKDILATIYYPDEGNKIQIKKGLNTIELSETIFHEIGHIIDWYISKGKQSLSISVREKIADYIGETLRFRKYKIDRS